MLKDCLEIFNNIYEKKGDRYILDSYSLGEGSYVLVGSYGEVKDIFQVDKKNNDKTHDGYDKFVEMDYLSKLLDMNKPIDPKKVIHSNNYLSFFIKKDNINGKLTEKIIDGYYEVLLNPLKKYKDKEKKNIYLEIENKYGKANVNTIEKNKNWIKEHIKNLADEIKKDKNYLKIFFDADIEEYKKESEKYVIPNIYNNTQYNIEISNSTYGLPNDNMGLNAKKPYLDNKSRKNTIPYLISTREVMQQKKLFDFLMNQASEGKTNVYVSHDKIKCLSNGETMEEDFNGYFLRIKKGKEVEIHDFDNVVKMKFKINGLKIIEVIPMDYSKYSKVKKNLDYGNINNVKKLKENIDRVFFNKFLAGNYFNDAKDIRLNDFRVKENLLKSRIAFFDWFYKGNPAVIKSIFGKVAMELIKNSICNEYIIKAKEQFNLRNGVLEYFKGANNMADILNGIANGLRVKINAKKTDEINSDEEYYFAVGQVASYFISLNKSSKKVHSFINPILNCKNDEKLKNEVMRLFKKYNYAIRQENKRVNNLTTMVLGYKPEKRVNDELLVAGYLYSNLVYESNKREEADHE